MHRFSASGIFRQLIAIAPRLYHKGPFPFMRNTSYLSRLPVIDENQACLFPQKYFILQDFFIIRTDQNGAALPR
jgi:hypothetical protein